MVRRKATNNARPMRAVLYLRYSSDRQTEQSIEGQQRVCESYCAREGIAIVGVYIDRALSASKETDKRLQFLKMVRDSSDGQFDAVVVYKLDRFARSRHDSATYKAILARNGVRVLSATEGIGDGIESIILESMLEGMAEYYSAELSQKVTRGMRESAYKGNVTGGSTTIGYKVEGKKYVIDEPRAQIVRRVFDLFVGGAAVSEIQRILANTGVRSANGKLIGRGTIERMLRQRRYIGIYTYDDIEVEGGIPAIIDREIFEEAQQRLTIRTTGPKPYSSAEDYLLSGKLFCGHCGSPMTGEASTSKSGKVYHYYGCSNHRNHGGCEMRRVRKDWIEMITAKDAAELLGNDSVRSQIVELVVKAAKAESDTDARADAVRKEAQEVDKRIGNLLDLVMQGVASDSAAQRIKELEDQKRGLLEQLKQFELTKIAVDPERVDYFLRQFARGDINDPEFRRKIIKMLVVSVTVTIDPDDPDGYKLTYTYAVTPNGKPERGSGNGKGGTLPTHLSVRVDLPLGHQRDSLRTPAEVVIYSDRIVYTVRRKK